MAKMKLNLMVIMMMALPNVSWGSVEQNKTTQIGFISKEDKAFFEEKVKPYWNQMIPESASEKIEIVLLTTYDSKGSVQTEKLAERIRKAPSNMKTFYVHWNERYSAQHEEWIKALNEQTKKGARVAFFAGLAQSGGRSIPLRQTLAAQVPNALILGELLDRERLPAQHYYGPELFSAFQDPASKGQGLSPLQFVSRWSSYKPQSDLNESLEELRRKKQKSTRMWPTADDFFGR